MAVKPGNERRSGLHRVCGVPGHHAQQRSGQALAQRVLFSSGQAMAGSTVLATQPASCRPSARMASTVSSAWFRQRRRMPTTSTTGRPGPPPGRPGSRCLERHAPAAEPSTSTTSARQRSSRYAATSSATPMRRPAGAAARWGDSGSGTETGCPARAARPRWMQRARPAGLPQPTRRRVSPDRPPPASCRPRGRGRASVCSSAALTRVLPRPVSVP